MANIPFTNTCSEFSSQRGYQATFHRPYGGLGLLSIHERAHACVGRIGHRPQQPGERDHGGAADPARRRRAGDRRPGLSPGRQLPCNTSPAVSINYV